MSAGELSAEAQIENGVCYLSIRGAGAVTLTLTTSARRDLIALLFRLSPDDESEPGESITLEGCSLTLCA